MTSCQATPILAIIAVGSASACGPKLRRSREFTPRAVRELKYNDACKLQRFFDKLPPGRRAESEFHVDTDAKLAAGVATFKVRGAELRALLKLLRRFYLRLPGKLSAAKTLRVTLPFSRNSAGYRTLPIGGKAEAKCDAPCSDELELPYHPCLGAFFYGREFYKARRRTIVE